MFWAWFGGERGDFQTHTPDASSLSFCFCVGVFSAAFGSRTRTRGRSRRAGAAPCLLLRGGRGGCSRVVARPFALGLRRVRLISMRSVPLFVFDYTLRVLKLENLAPREKIDEPLCDAAAVLALSCAIVLRSLSHGHAQPTP